MNAISSWNAAKMRSCADEEIFDRHPGDWTQEVFDQ